MSIKSVIKKWFAGDATDKEVSAYIRSAFVHLVSEYRSVYFVKCGCKENPSTADIDTNEATNVKEQNQNSEHAQAQEAGNAQESLTGLQSESTQKSYTGDAIAVEEQNKNWSHEQLQSTVDVQRSLTSSLSESTQQSYIGDANAVKDQNQDLEQEQVNSTAADAPESPKIDPILSGCACLQSP